MSTTMDDDMGVASNGRSPVVTIGLRSVMVIHDDLDGGLPPSSEAQKIVGIDSP